MIYCTWRSVLTVRELACGPKVTRAARHATLSARSSGFSRTLGRPRSPGRRNWPIGLLVAVLFIAVLWLPLTGATAAGSDAAHSSSTITASLDIGAAQPNLVRSFFGINGESAQTAAFTTVPKLGTYLNSTPIGMIRYSAGEDECNVTSNTDWSPGLLGGVATPGCAYDIASFAAWCDSLSPHCESDVGLPGENNDSSEDAYYAQYIVNTLGFQPTYWSIGNEPISWTHYGIPWKNWKITDDSTATGTAYAVDVRNAVKAVSAVDPAAQFVGIQSYWCPDTTYTDPTAAIDGNSVDAMACHVYTNDGTSTPSTQQYFASLTGPHSITSNYYAIQDHIESLCNTCGSIPIQISEYQGGPVSVPAPQDRQYDGAIWLAASLVQAADAGIPSVQIFDLQGTSGCQFCLLNSNYDPDAQGLLLSDVFENVELGHPVYNVTVSSSDSNLWATVIHDWATNETQVLFVNANVSHAETFGVMTKFFGVGQPGSIISWNNSAPTPTSTSYHALPSRITVPSVGLVLITVTPKSGSAHQRPVTPVPTDPSSVTQAAVLGAHAFWLPAGTGMTYLALAAAPGASEPGPRLPRRRTTPSSLRDR